MADAVMIWCRDVLANRRVSTTLVLAGDTGTGKTHAMVGASEWVRAHDITGYNIGCWQNVIDSMFADWPAVVSGLSESYDEDVLELLFQADVLFIDDVGAEIDRWKTGAPVEWLRRVLGRREGMFTMISTNIPPSEWSNRWDARVEDRFLRRSIVVDLFEVPSYSMRAGR